MKPRKVGLSGTSSELLLKGRLRGFQRMQMYKLLDMLYTPRELAQEAGFTQRQVYRVYLPAGCPHERDTMRRAWINGRAFREWYEITYPRVKLKDNEAFCLSCRKPVSMDTRVRKEKGAIQVLVGFLSELWAKAGKDHSERQGEA